MCRKLAEPFPFRHSEDDSAVLISSGLLIAVSAEHEMKLGDLIKTVQPHNRQRTMGWHRFHPSLIYQHVTEVRESEALIEAEMKGKDGNKWIELSLGLGDYTSLIIGVISFCLQISEIF